MPQDDCDLPPIQASKGSDMAGQVEEQMGTQQFADGG
jgi:hypothetical protein